MMQVVVRQPRLLVCTHIKICQYSLLQSSLRWYPIELSHMPFCLIPEVFNAVNMVMFFRK